MAIKTERAEVVCPFYSSDDMSRKITCEGMVKGSTVTHRFNKKLHWEKHIKNCCCGDCQKCPWYKTLMDAKY